MITVQVIRQGSGKPEQGKKIATSLNIADSKYTDSNGEAHFDVKPGSGQVYVDGSVKHKGRIEGRVVVYI